VVEARIKRFGLAIKAGQDFDLINPEDDRVIVPMCNPISTRRSMVSRPMRANVVPQRDGFRTLAVIRGEADAIDLRRRGRT